MEYQPPSNPYTLSTPEENARRLQELAAWGVDLSLIQAALSRTPTQRIERMLELLALARAMRHGIYQACKHRPKDHAILPQIEATLRLRQRRS